MQGPAPMSAAPLLLLDLLLRMGDWGGNSHYWAGRPSRFLF
jgi:hypothetical protein